MNKYISTFLRILKYIGIVLLVGYLVMVVTTLNKQKDEDLSLKERIANATIGSLYAYVIYVSIFLSDPTGSSGRAYPKL